MTINRKLASCLLFAAIFTPLPSASAPAGHVIVARVSNDALVIWDATDEVVDIVHGKVSDSVANGALERDGLTALASKLSVLDKSSRTVTLRIIYRKIKAVNSEYGTPTLAGVERYATIELSGKDIFDDRDKWSQLPASSPLPAWIQFKVTGQLPPR